MANRSPSPNPTRPTTPRVSKHPEPSSSARRCIDLNPSKPSDSPHGAQPFLRSSFEQKENEREPNASKLGRMRSPVLPASKGAKNFMSPTISASSKAVSASPRKKILAERNEVIRSSLSSASDSLHSPQLEEAPAVLPSALKVLKASHGTVEEEEEENGLRDGVDFVAHEAFDESHHRKIEHEVENHQSILLPSSPPSVIAAIDADPHLPPYDPKTNYLSPRPQFLHYRPNPRVEQYLKGERDLFDSFSSESCEDATEHTGESPASSPLKESLEEPSSSEAEAREISGGVCIPESESDPNSHDTHVKSRSPQRFKFAPLVLVLFIVCICAPLSDTPTFSSSSVLRAPDFQAFRELYTTGHYGISNWSLKELYAGVASSPHEEFGSYHTSNMTALAVDQVIDKYYSYPETKPSKEQISMTSEVEQDFDAGDGMEEKVKEEAVCDAELVGAEYAEEQTDKQDEAGLEELEGDGSVIIREEVKEHVTNENADEHEQRENSDEPVSVPEKVENQEGCSAFDNGFDSDHSVANANAGEDEQRESSNELISEPEKVESQENCGACNDGFDSSDRIDVIREVHRTSAGSELEELPSLNGSESRISTGAVVGIASIAVGLFAIILYMKQMKNSHSDVAHEGAAAEKAVSGSISGSSETYLNRIGSRYEGSMIDSETVGGYDAAIELSSSLDNSLSSGRQRRRSREVNKEEDLSYERRPRRESTTISSSTSYGSFTTYEKVSAKKGGGKDDEAMTPVRRSSRIRNQVASP